VNAKLPSGIIPAWHQAKNVLKKIVHGGSVEEHRLFALLMKELKDDVVNMDKYAKSGTAEPHLDHLRQLVNQYEAEYHRVHSQEYPSSSPAVPASTNPPPFAPGFGAPSAPSMKSVACHWVLVPR
jgi:hypothetical protein